MLTDSTRLEPGVSILFDTEPQQKLQPPNEKIHVWEVCPICGQSSECNVTPVQYKAKYNKKDYRTCMGCTRAALSWRFVAHKRPFIGSIVDGGA